MTPGEVNARPNKYAKKKKMKITKQLEGFQGKLH